MVAWGARGVGGTVDVALTQATGQGVTCRERTLVVSDDGSSHESSTGITFYVSEDSYRMDIHDGGFLREIQWYTPDGDSMIQTSVRFDLSSFSCVSA